LRRISSRPRFVDLLLVLHDSQLGLRVVEHVGHLVRHRVLIGGHCHSADALHGSKRGIQARTIVADDGHHIATLEAELAQADGKGADFVTHLRPGPRLPDAEILVADRWPVAMYGGVAQQQLGYRVQGLPSGGHGASRRTWGAHRHIPP
jgi:hypothetical protein